MKDRGESPAGIERTGENLNGNRSGNRESRTGIGNRETGIENRETGIEKRETGIEERSGENLQRESKGQGRI